MSKLDFIDLSQPEIFQTPVLSNIYDRAKCLKERFTHLGCYPKVARGKYLATIYLKQSLRTFLSFEVAMRNLGGEPIDINPERVNIGNRESVKDVAATISSYCHAVMLRTGCHQIVTDMAKYATVPVINGLTDFSHPCQAGADIMTLEETFGQLNGLVVTFVGDGNNVARSLAEACHYFGVTFIICTPKGYELSDMACNGYFSETDPKKAVRDAHVVCTDAWYGMHQQNERRERRDIFRPYQVNAELLEHAPAGVKVMHCQPMHRNEEITDEVADGDASIIRLQATNRLHFQRGLLYHLLAEPEQKTRQRKHPTATRAHHTVSAAA